MTTDWDCLSDNAQLFLARTALEDAVSTLAGQADALAAEMEAGLLTDRGGPEALRLLAVFLRIGRDLG
jgi:hypothetical protein